MLIKVTKYNIQLKKRGISKVAFIAKVFCLISKLATIKESLKGYYYYNNYINFINLLILYYYKEVYTYIKGRFKDI